MNFEILEKTFESIQLQARPFARSFYNKLFLVSPEMRGLFEHVDMADQEKKLMYSLAMIVEGMQNLESLKCIVRNLGQRHLTYKVSARHYNVLGQVLLGTLAEYLGSQWTIEAEQVWREAYEIIADLMLEGTTKEYMNSSLNRAKGNGGVKSILKDLRLQAITEKSIHQYQSNELVAQMLMQDEYIQDLKEKIGRAKTEEIIEKLLKKVEKKQLRR
ncbi:MAG: globin domain-containing protein [Prochloraceae cyanobacterium]|nr:globin domain-containing protein [Prochloraceae cyanobacterium]